MQGNMWVTCAEEGSVIGGICVCVSVECTWGVPMLQSVLSLLYVFVLSMNEPGACFPAFHVPRLLKKESPSYSRITGSSFERLVPRTHVSFRSRGGPLVFALHIRLAQLVMGHPCFYPGTLYDTRVFIANPIVRHTFLVYTWSMAMGKFRIYDCVESRMRDVYTIIDTGGGGELEEVDDIVTTTRSRLWCRTCILALVASGRSW